MTKLNYLLVTLTLLILSISSATAQHPALGGGNGTNATPYLIGTAAQLADLATYVNAGNGNATLNRYYKLTADINLNGYTADAGWAPVGNAGSSFQGNFDGNYRKVRNLTISRAGQGRTGLFGSVSNASIKNLGVEDCLIEGGNYTGGLAGYADASAISGCYTTGIVAGASYSGGLVGANSSTINNSYSTANVNGEDYTGGLAGSNNTGASISYCYASGNINAGNAGTTTGNYAGGLAGYNQGTIRNCVAANNFVSTIRTGSGTYIRRLVGYNNGGTLQNNYANSAMSVLIIITPVTPTDNLNGDAGMGKTLVELKTQSFYAIAGNWNGGAWDFTDVWQITEGNLPVLKTPIFPCHADDKQALRNFLIQQTDEVYNYTKAGLDATDISTWTASEAWIEKLPGLTWNIENPRRIIKIEWNNKNLSGDFDLSGCAALRELYCHTNQISSLNLTNNTALTDLNCSNNKLTAFDVTNNTALKFLHCYTNHLTSLDISGLSLLTDFNAASQTVSLTLTKNYDTGKYEIALPLNIPFFGAAAVSYSGGILQVSSPAPASTNFQVVTTGHASHIYGTMYFTYIDPAAPDIYHADDKKALRDFLIQQTDGGYNYTKAGLDATDISAWTTSETWITKITGITWNAENPRRVTRLSWGNKGFTGSFDLSDFAALTYLDCSLNKLTTLIGNTALTELNCFGNQLSTLDVSKSTNLSSLMCENNKLSELDVSKNTALLFLSVSNNQFSELDVSKNTVLMGLVCRDNQLETLDLTQNTELITLYCRNNHLTALYFGSNAPNSFEGDDQTVSVTLYKNGDNYQAAFSLNAPFLAHPAISYENDILQSSNKLVPETFFSVSAYNFPGLQLTGTMSFIYEDATPPTTVTTDVDLIAALQSTTPSTIVMGANITIGGTQVMMGANHTLNTDGNTLTINNNLNINSDSKELTINGGGVVSVENTTQSGVNGGGILILENVTVNLGNTIAGGLGNINIDINNGAVVNIDSPTGRDLLNVGINRTLNLNTGGTINILSFDDNYNGIANSSGTMHINGGTVNILSTQTKNIGINSGGLLKYTSGTLTSTVGGTIYLFRYTRVEGMNGKFNDRGILFTAPGEVTIGAETAIPSANGLTHGAYIWNGSVFKKSAIYTVTFAGEDISIASQTVEAGDFVIRPEDPERENYNFDGWFTDNSTFLNKWDFETDIVTQDTTLYAKWEKITGIAEIESAGIKIYPTPVKDVLFLINNEQLIINNVEIVDLSGRTLRSLKSQEATIDVSHLPSGIYFVTLETDNGVVTRKFIKQ